MTNSHSPSSADIWDVEAIHQTIYRRVYKAVEHILGEQHLTGTIWLATQQAAEDITESLAKATKGKAGMAGGTPTVRRSTAGTGLQVGAADAVQPATSEIMDVTSRERPAPTFTAAQASRRPLCRCHLMDNSCEIHGAGKAHHQSSAGSAKEILNREDDRPLPTYGQIPWKQLGRDVMDVIYAKREDYEFDPTYYEGHQIVPRINFNSLARIVDKYRWHGLLNEPQEVPETVKISIKPMGLSDGSTDYYVALTVGKREITPYKFKEEWQAQYEADSFRWLLLGAPKPDLLAYGPTSTLSRPHGRTGEA